MANHHKNGPQAAASGPAKAYVGRGVRVTVRFGDAVITGARPSREIVEKNVGMSTVVLEQATRKLAVPGIKLPSKRDVPQFFADDANPDIIVRRLNGRLQRGRLVNGSFKAID
jgi:hypothetical protein